MGCGWSVAEVQDGFHGLGLVCRSRAREIPWVSTVCRSSARWGAWVVVDLSQTCERVATGCLSQTSESVSMGCSWSIAEAREGIHGV